MTDLATWVETYTNELVSLSVAKLTEDNDILQSQVVESVEIFFRSMVDTLRANDMIPLYNTLNSWAETLHTVPEDEAHGLTLVLAQLKQSLSEQIREVCLPEEAFSLFVIADVVFTDAMIYVSRIESDALVTTIRSRLQKALSDLQRLDKSKTDFIAIAAHEFKTPLTVIEGYTGMIRNTAVTDDHPEVLGLIGGIENGVRRLREIVDDIVDVSMIDLKMLKLRLQPVWLQQLLDAIQKNVNDSLQQRSLELDIQKNTIPTQFTFADPERLLQALQKVIMNAIKYTPDGGKITVIGRELPGFLDLMVVDKGIGISPRDLTRIFNAFSSSGDVSLHSSGKTKFKGGGPGLGLPIAKGIIEAHGGTIWAESPGYDEKANPGSTFHMMIPMRTSPPDENAAIF